MSVFPVDEQKPHCDSSDSGSRRQARMRARTLPFVDRNEMLLRGVPLFPRP